MPGLPAKVVNLLRELVLAKEYHNRLALTYRNVAMVTWTVILFFAIVNNFFTAAVPQQVFRLNIVIALAAGFNLAACLYQWRAREIGASQLGGFLVGLSVLVTVTILLSGGAHSPWYKGYVPLVLAFSMTATHGIALLYTLSIITLWAVISLLVPGDIGFAEEDWVDLAAHLGVLAMVGFLGSSLSYYERRERQAAQQAQGRYQDLYDNAPDMYFTCDLEGNVLTCNLAAANALGRPREEVIGRHGLELMTPKSREGFPSHLALALRGEYPANTELELQRQDGTTLPVLSNVRLLRDDRGNPQSILVALLDITRRKEAEEAREAAFATLHAIVESSYDAIIIATERGRIILFNPAAQATFGYSEEEAVGQDLDILMPPRHKGKHLEYIRRYLETGTPRTLGWMGVEEEGQRKSGEVFPVEMFATEVWVRGERQFMTLTRDVTERKRLEREKLEAQRSAVIGQASAILGHDLRTPLGVIRNAAYYLRSRLGDGDQRIAHNLNLIDQEIAACDAIIGEMLDFARAREPELAPVELNGLVAEALEIAGAPANVQVTFHGAAGRANALGDREMMRRVFLNILLNAIEAMPEGGKLDIAILATDSQIEVTFRDTGVGIPQGDLERIFEPLFTTKPRGAGLGLAMVKGVVERHAGTITVQSEVGKGTTFTISLPVARPEAGGAAPIESLSKSTFSAS